MDDAIYLTAGRISHLLDELGIRHGLTGGIVSARYGEPRTTRDVDLVATFSNPLQVASLLSALSKEQYHLNAGQAREAIQNQGMFTCLDMQTFFKIDFHMGEQVPGELQRLRKLEIMPGLIVPCLSPEDAILSKLLWIQKGSHRSRRDVVGIIKRSSDLDWDYLNRMSDTLKVSSLFEELRNSDLETEN